ncbi:MAG: GGDEF domain-containing protein, partial [Pseudomonadota bacterium]
MSFINEKERAVASRISTQAIDRMNLDKLMPNPENYELWFSYYSRSLPEIVRIIDGIIESGQTITDYICTELYNRFLSDLRNEQIVRTAGEQVQSTIDNVTGMVHDAQVASEGYGKTLSHVSSRIAAANSEGELQAVVRMASESTNAMLAHSTQLEDMLRKSTAMMEEMKRDLEHVRREAMTDGLTGLANRKAFDNEIDQIMQESASQNKGFTLLMLDIDHFKSF